MEGHELLGKLTKVRAPAGFEEAVLGRLPAARRERRRARRARFVFSFAGSAALILAAVLVFRPAAPEKDAVLSYAEREALSAAPGKGPGGTSAGRSGVVPVYETMDYASEFRNVQPQPVTVYILEQVSEIPSSEIIY
jgi:hypothetical protein